MVTLDIIVDLQYGDSGKGKVAHFLCEKRNYTHVIRYNGGSNAGHTLFHRGVKLVTHQVPVGVFWGIRSIIGAGCVVDPDALLKEIHELESTGVKVKGLLFIAQNAHVVTKRHKKEDSGDTRIGTTRRGIGPAYTDKYARKGIRVETIRVLRPYLIDSFKEFFSDRRNLTVLAEGAQGFGLDIDWGDYPFVTSSHCTAAGALLSGFPPRSVRQIWGVAKVYETYVGKKAFEPKEKVFMKIREIGEEYGATTGRPRQCNWLDVDMLQKAAHMNGATHVVFNKMDVLNNVGVWKARLKKNLVSFRDPNEMKSFLRKRLVVAGVSPKNIYFSERKDGI